MRSTWLVVGGLVIGVVAVLAIAAIVWQGPVGDRGESTPVDVTFPAVDHDRAAAEDLVVAWNRWRTATYASTGTWRRVLDGADAPLEGDIYTAQQPPRRLVVRLGAVIEEIDGEVTTCDSADAEVIVPECTRSTGSLTYDERLRAEMSLVLAYVIGDDRIYDVAAEGDCFRVELVEAALRSPWGRAAEFCFDAESGALASSRVRRRSAIDEEFTTSIRTEVTDADF